MQFPRIGDYVYADPLGYYQIETLFPDTIYAVKVEAPWRYIRLVPGDDGWTVKEHPGPVFFIPQESFTQPKLPAELIAEIGLRVNFLTVFQLCRVSRSFNSAICRNETFWQRRYSRDFEPLLMAPLGWRNQYLEEYTKRSSNIYVFGDNSNGVLLPGEQPFLIIPTLIHGIKGKAASIGGSFTVIIDFDNSVWIAGKVHWSSSLGLGNVLNVRRYTRIEGLRAKAVACGYEHTIIIAMDQTVWGFGNNSQGQLGLGPNINVQHTPIMIPDLKAKRVAAGRKHTLVIDLEDNLYVFGRNNAGQLGLGHNRNQYEPTLLPGLKFKEIAARHNHSLAIDSNDNVLGFGDNAQYQLTNTYGKNLYLPLPLGIKGKFVATGDFHSIVIDISNEVWTVGNIPTGLARGRDPRALGKVEGSIRAKAAAAGIFHTIILGVDKGIYVSGSNSHGQLGLGSEFGSAGPVKLSGIKGKFITANGDRSLIIGNINP